MDFVDFAQVVKAKKEIVETNALLREQIGLLKEIRDLLKAKRL